MATWKERASEIKSYLEQGKSYAEIAKIYGANKKTTRNRIAEMRADGWLDNPPVVETHESEVRTTKRTVEFNKDGSYTSQRDKLWLRSDMIYDRDYILTQHGLNPADWELISMRHNQWENYSQKDGITELYASRVTVKPKTKSWTVDDLLAVIRADVKPVEIQYDVKMFHSERMLEIPLLDMHVGISDLNHYKATQEKIYRLLSSRHWEETFFVIGSDLLHVDNFKNTTFNGTQIEAIDIPRAWNDASMFYGVLIDTAIRQSNFVSIMYSPGNHDFTLSWSFVQYLKARYPMIEFDDAPEQRKCKVFGYNFIGVTHGDKGRKNLVNVFPAEFPLEWSQTKNREIHTGHYHSEDAKDGPGIMIRTLATRNKTDAWHKENGFVGTHKRFQLFEYSRDELECIYYV